MKTMLVSRRALVCALALSPLASAQGTVWTVDDDSPADFVELQPAINAASDGDLILLRPGVYQSASIDAKSLTLQVDGAPGSVEVNGLVSIFGYVPPALSISNIAAHQSVTIRGLRANAWGFSIPDLVVSVGACQGPVLFEDCEFVNGAGDAV